MVAYFNAFINNGIAIVALYTVRNNSARVEKVMDENFPIYWGLIACAAIYYLLIKLKKNSQDGGLEKSI